MADKRVVEILRDGLTVLGTVRLAGQRVEVPQDFYIPSPQDQVRRWGHLKCRVLGDEDFETSDAGGAEDRDWSELSANDLGELAAGFSDSELARFRAWAEESAAGGNEAAVVVLDALGDR